VLDGVAIAEGGLWGCGGQFDVIRELVIFLSGKYDVNAIAK